MSVIYVDFKYFTIYVNTNLVNANTLLTLFYFVYDYFMM
jgi:hypothetical protein